eukprot:CAMPEP_0198681804 /NCGR_PEP_ID=MMETSP1468-20131203/7536_1 /TAXON_ID=1461545 /ORGANISM="Mantoniella sp, Strain CCMP1436" /LENGTH=138 /DNA_ID=CAMNT_0044424009 /DNA_START=112 /DNA_END=528 /DNA_ORIENTATION=+
MSASVAANRSPPNGQPSLGGSEDEGSDGAGDGGVSKPKSKGGKKKAGRQPQWLDTESLVATQVVAIANERGQTTRTEVRYAAANVAFVPRLQTSERLGLFVPGRDRTAQPKTVAQSIALRTRAETPGRLNPKPQTSNP